MTFQYALRFESGKRRGEVVPITVVPARGGTFTIGRKPGNSLQVTESSVSGRHAEIELSAGSVAIRDLDSTNGLMVGGRRVRQSELASGQEFSIGNVEFTLVDQLGEDLDEIVLEDPGTPAPAPMPSKRVARPAAAPAAEALAREAPASEALAPAAQASYDDTVDLESTRIQPRDEGIEITAEDLARSKRSSKLGPIVLVGLAAAGAGAWWWQSQGSTDDGGSGSGTAAAPVTPPAGNLLAAGYSFEKTEGWAADDSVAGVFDTSSGARKSGRRGVRAELYGGEQAVLISDPVRLSGRDRGVLASAWIRGEGDASAQLGLRFANRDASVVSTAWSETVSGSDEFQEILLEGLAPKGLDMVSVLLRGVGTGAAAPAEDAEGDLPAPAEIDADDVALVPSTEARPALNHQDWTVAKVAAPSGSDAVSLSIGVLDTLLVSSLRMTSGDDAQAPAAFQVEVADEPGRATLVAGAAGSLVVRAEPALASAGVATMADYGYSSHGATFERDGAEGLLLGSDATLVRLGFPAPVNVEGRPSGDGVVVRVPVQRGDRIELQLAFSEERTRAQVLSREALEFRREGNSGEALKTWAKLLREVPYEQNLIDRAASEQSELIAEGRDALKALGQEVERARFFRLADLYRQKLERAQELATRYEGSEVEGQAVALGESIRLELAALERGRGQNESSRLEAIESVLKRNGASSLASRVAEYRSGEGGEDAANEGND